MKRIFAITFFVSVMCGVVFAQSRFTEFEKAKSIKLLESTRSDVRQIFSDYKSEDEDAEKFITTDAFIEVVYIENGCSEQNSDKSVKWNVSDEKILYLTISPRKEINIKDLDINISSYRKEQKYANVEDEFIYHNKNFGFAFEVKENEIEKIYIFPSRSYQSFLCDDKDSKEIFLSESWFNEPNPEDRIYNPPGNPPPPISAVELSAVEITIGCKNSAGEKYCSDISKINVNTIPTDTENKKLKYEYTVSGGKILGQGKQVIWDLSGAKPGTYTITVGINDGCGICGQTLTKTVVVRECDDCIRESSGDTAEGNRNTP